MNGDQVQTAPEVLYTPTPDGWQLALHLWRGLGQRRPHPVLMVHGLAANRKNLDLDDQLSIARAAQSHGYDVYLVDLRGAGLSRPPGGKARNTFQWGFGDFAVYDIPAAVEFVLNHSSADSLHGFGHSMGGMLLYAFAVSQPPELRSIVSVGSPFVAEIRLAPRERRLLNMLTRFNPNRQGRLPLRKLFSAGGRFIGFTGRLVDGSLLNASNIDQDLMGRLARESIDDVPQQLLREFATSIGRSEIADGPFSYESELGRIAVPVLSLGGSVDRIAPPAAVRAAVRRIRSPDVRYREMGRRFGDRADYGHIDLLVGHHAPTEIYAPIIDFWDELEEH